MKILGVVAVTLAPLVSCTYGPSTRQAMITNVALRPGTTDFVAAVHVRIFRPPTGLAAFPDGGIPKTLREYGLFYLCDSHERTARLLGRLDRPSEFLSGSEPWAIGWQADTLYVKFTGQTGTTIRDLNHAVYFAWVKEGGFSRISKSPDPSITPLTSSGVNGLPGPAILVSKGPWDIGISTAIGLVSQQAFILDKETGDLSGTPRQ